MAASTIEEGKFKIQTVGPAKDIPNKKDPNKPWRSWSLQFENDPSWYDTFWVRDTDPKVGEELDGGKQEDEKFGLQFKLKWSGGGNKANWNPAGANATVMTAAVAVVNGFLGLKPQHLEDWEKKRRTGQTAVTQYIETVVAIAGQLKQEVVKLGGNEVQTKAESSAAPPADGDPGPVAPAPDDENWADGEEEEVDLGPM